MYVRTKAQANTAQALAKIETVMKVRGLTLDWNSSQILQYSTFKYLVLNYDTPPPIILYGEELENNSELIKKFPKN
jgi:hypothetical protein